MSWDQVCAALSALEEAWSGREALPKDALLPMVDAACRIEAAAVRYLEQRDELEALAFDLRDRMGHMLYPRTLTPMPEAEAMAIVRAGLGGMGGFLLNLHWRFGLNRAELRDIEEALDALAMYWAECIDVPRFVAATLVDVRHTILAEAHWYPERQDELAAVANDLAQRAERCLAPRTPLP